MSANDSGNGTGIWGITRLAAPALVALVLAGVALPWILDSGAAHLPAIGVGVSTGAASGPPAVAKVEVTSSPSKSTGTQHHPHSTAASTAPAQTSNLATGSTSNAGGQTATSPVVHPAHGSSAGPTKTAAPPSPVIKTTPRSHQSTPVNPPATTIKGQGEGEQGDESPKTSHHGLALGHEKHAFRARADKDKGQPPRGLALGHRNHVPPGLARKEHRRARGGALGHRNHVPPGQARSHNESRGQNNDDQGQDSQGDNDEQGNSSHGHDSDEQGDSSHGHHGDTPPGHANGSHGSDSHGRGHGH